MRLSIRLRVVVAACAVIIAGVAAMGYVAADAAGRMVQEKLFSEQMANTASFLRERRLPMSDTMMGYLHRITGLDAAAFDGPSGRMVGCSLPAGAAAGLADALRAGRVEGPIDLEGTRYRLGSCEMPRAAGSDSATRLFLLMPQQRLDDARQQVMWQIGGLAAPVVLAAAVAASLLSLSVTRPLERMVRELDSLSADPSTTMPAGGGPAEVVRLRQAFWRLLGRLKAAQDDLARTAALATVGKISASVAHEVKNPLSGIKMNVRVLQDQYAQHGISDEAFGLITREIDRIDLYLQELLGLLGGAEAPPQPVRLEELTESVLALVAGRCRHESIRIERNVSPCPPVLAQGDRIRQVVLNLAINAIEAMPSGGVLTLSLAPAQDGVRLTVADTGSGVPVDAGDIFEPLVSTKPGSAGLGLHICRQIIQRHGGRLGYDSGPGGASFWFELPAAVSSA
jgi:signal transduction histidine kinase